MKCEIEGSIPRNTVKEVDLVVTLNVKINVSNETMQNFNFL